MALTLLMKTIAMMTMVLILMNLSGAAPFTATANTEFKQVATDKYTQHATFSASTLIKNSMISIASTNSSSWRYTAAQFPPSARPTHDYSIYTLADTTGEDLPSAIPLDGTNIAPLATADYTSKSAPTTTERKIVPRVIIGPLDGQLTTMEGVTTSVPFISATLFVTLPATSTDTAETTSAAEIPGVSHTENTTTSTTNAAPASSTTTHAKESKEVPKPALVAAVVVPSVLSALFAFVCVVFWRDRQRVEAGGEIFEMVTTEIYFQEFPEELRRGDR